MRLFIFSILLVFPALEVYVLFRLANYMGWWLAVWLVLSACGGLVLIQAARVSVPANLAAALQQRQSPLFGLLLSGRTLLAGLLFIFPGVLSDALAATLLLFPYHKRWGPAVPVAAQEHVIEGQFRRER